VAIEYLDGRTKKTQYGFSDIFGCYGKFGLEAAAAGRYAQAQPSDLGRDLQVFELPARGLAGVD
jgi:hypothetical protein